MREITNSLYKSNNQRSKSYFFFLMHAFFKIFIYLFLAALVFIAARGLFFNCGERGLLFFLVHGLLIVVASLAVEHRL